MKYLLLMLLLVIPNLCAENLISVQKYKYFINTSTSLQDAITQYHESIIKPDIDLVFEFNSVTDGGDRDSGDYKSAFQTKDGYVPAIMSYSKIIAAYKNVAFINLQLGSDNANFRDIFEPETSDSSLLINFKALNDDLDIVLGINRHSEPGYDTINGTEYFSTTEEGKGSFNIVYSAIYKQINLNMLINSNLTPEQTIASYQFNTSYGSISPKVLVGINDEFNYLDTFVTYASKNKFKYQNVNLDASVKTRLIYDDGDSPAHNAFSGYIEMDKKFLKVLQFSVGVSQTNEYSIDYKFGYMASIGYGVSRFTRKGKKMEIYWGLSRNYYPNLQNLALIDQTLGLINVKIYQ